MLTTTKTRSRSSSDASITRDAVLTAAGAVVGVNGLMRAASTERHRKRHVAEAIIGTGVAAAAFQHARKSLTEIEQSKVDVKVEEYSSSECDSEPDCHYEPHIRGALPAAPEVVVNVHDRDHSGERRHRHRHDHRSSKTHKSHDEHREVRKEKKHEHESTKKHIMHLAQEAVGAYGVAKQALGDKEHTVRHIVEAAVGAAGLLGEIRGHGLHAH